MALVTRHFSDAEVIYTISGTKQEISLRMEISVSRPKGGQPWTFSFCLPLLLSPSSNLICYHISVFFVPGPRASLVLVIFKGVIFHSKFRVYSFRGTDVRRFSFPPYYFFFFEGWGCKRSVTEVLPRFRHCCN